MRQLQAADSEQYSDESEAQLMILTLEPERENVLGMTNGRASVRVLQL